MSNTIHEEELTKLIDFGTFVLFALHCEAITETMGCSLNDIPDAVKDEMFAASYDKAIDLSQVYCEMYGIDKVAIKSDSEVTKILDGMGNTIKVFS